LTRMVNVDTALTKKRNEKMERALKNLSMSNEEKILRQ